MPDNKGSLGPDLIDEADETAAPPASKGAGTSSAPAVKTAKPAAPSSYVPSEPRQQSRLDRFERGDFTARSQRQAVATLVPETQGVSTDASPSDAPPESEPGDTYTGDKLFVADYLRNTLKWSRQDIEEIFAGPEEASIHYIAGKRVDAKTISTAEANPLPAVPADSVKPAGAATPKAKPPEVSSRADSAPVTSGGAARQPSASVVSAPAPSQTPAPFGQKQIVDAIEASIAGNVTPLAEIARRVKELPGPLQAYLVAAARRSVAYHKDIVAYIKDFNAREIPKAKKRDADAKAGLEVAGAVAAAANVIPVVGQVVSVILAVGVAVAAALTENFRLPARDPKDQIRDGYEGFTIFMGIGLSPSTEDPFIDSYLGIKQAVVQDVVAFTLPQVARKTPFAWVPSYADFREAAHELKLYPEDQQGPSK